MWAHLKMCKSSFQPAGAYRGSSPAEAEAFFKVFPSGDQTTNTAASRPASLIFIEMWTELQNGIQRTVESEK